MKVTPADLATLRQHIEPLDTEEVRDKYRAGDFPRSHEVKDLNTRFRWDLYWMIPADVRHAGRDNGYTDTHIDTALRAIVPPL